MHSQEASESYSRFMTVVALPKHRSYLAILDRAGLFDLELPIKDRNDSWSVGKWILGQLRERVRGPFKRYLSLL